MARHGPAPRAEPVLGGDSCGAGLSRLSAARLPPGRSRGNPGPSIRRANRPGAITGGIRGRAPALRHLAVRSAVWPPLASGRAVGVAAVLRRTVGVDEVRMDVGVVRAVELDLSLR